MLTKERPSPALFYWFQAPAWEPTTPRLPPRRHAHTGRPGPYPSIIIFRPQEQPVKRHDVRVVGPPKHVLNRRKADSRQVLATESAPGHAQIKPGLHQPPG